MEVTSKAISFQSEQQEKLIDFETDSVAADLVERMYLNLKKQKATQLTEEQLSWIEKVESSYSKIRAIKKNAFREFLDGTEKVVRSTLSLDFSNKVTISANQLDERNILNYVTFAFNMLIEKMECSMVSMKAVNIMLTAPPQSALIVTDTKGRIRFINNAGESLLCIQNNVLLNQSVYPLFKSNNEIIKNCVEHCAKLTDVKVQLVLNEQIIPVLLTAIHSDTEEDEITEVVFIIKTKEQEGKEIKLRQQSCEDIVTPLNPITEMLHLLKSKSKDIDSQHLITYLEESAAIIKKDKQQQYRKDIPASASRDLVNIEFIYDRIIEGLQFNENFSEVIFYKDISHKHELYSDATLLYSIVQKIITIAVNYRDVNSGSKMQFTVRDLSDTDLLIIIHFSGGEISLENLNNRFEKNSKEAFNVDAKNHELFSVREAIRKLNGSLEIYSKLGKDAVFTISLPY